MSQFTAAKRHLVTATELQRQFEQIRNNKQRRSGLESDFYSKAINDLMNYGTTGMPVTPPSNIYETPTGLLKSIAHRLRVPEGDRLGFEAIHAHKSDEKVFVFLVTGGKAVTLEDDWGLFPSDTLITQLRTLKG